MTLQQPLTNVRKVLIPAKVFPLRDKSEREKNPSHSISYGMWRIFNFFRKRSKKERGMLDAN
ncbi:hypothetical protein ABD90_21010 [Lysinibacillus fusiformis]|uniref:Uncharacterized protein n=1 Tax=Lysinibacillus sphaericus CBAM5 TaxID=1400869 RepID=W7S5C7_LYSSH|nr:hypothetical protein P799_10425 [Lysinibacillus sphaericus CBAM5]MBG9691066.1 hypothetical protein [Lysinibacillus sphaericus]MBG9727666.1 hypothetical protein [Lysinibacillus fusiformis]MBG9711184.1 hypothetical protein [Lysinibacillus sphaericus]MBG9731483.1 hypothetical protein [Lysinibacillus sphaericus]